MALFKRFRNSAAAGDAAVAERLGSEWIAARREAGSMAPAQCVTVVYSESGSSRRLVSFRSDGGAAKIACMKGERAWCFHPGPYVADIVPFAAAPEIGLRMVFVIDAADPRVTQQRFDLFLVSEMEADLAQLTLESFGGQAQAAVRAALEQGVLDLPPCTSLDEWNLFRAGLNELMYTRFGVTVEDCVPVDLAPAVDYAAMLRGRAAAQAPAGPAGAVYKGAAASGYADQPKSQGLPSPPPATPAAAAGAPQHAASPAWPTPTMASSTPKLPARAIPVASAAPSPTSASATSRPAGAVAAGERQHPAGPAVPVAAASQQPGDQAEGGAPNASSTPARPAAPAGAPSSRGQVEPPIAHNAGEPFAAPGAMAGPHIPVTPAAGGSPLPSGWTAAHSPRAAKRDAAAIRRLFLELPAISAALRQIALPEGQKTFKQQQSILQRLSLLALDAGTMPSLDWASPDQKAKQAHRTERADQSRRAVIALDEAWSLLARFKQAGPDDAAGCLQEADRIAANLEYHLARRRNAEPVSEDRVEPRL
ncbi:hypothetical protein [Pseudoduganella rhizocola]|uniref:hypothetical protein n=1 Tax=Pseudoduganella rhizocola TaxID=3382643 RepID=UPI0038B6A730